MSTSHLALNQIITTTSSTKHTSIHSITPTNWVSLNPPLNTLFAASVYSTHAYPPILTDEADIQAHKAVVNTPEFHHGIGIKDGVAIVYNKFAPLAHVVTHRTETIDFGVIIEGELLLLFDDDEDGNPREPVLMKKGDVVVQRATMHGWKNPSETNETIILFTAMTARAVEVGGEALREDMTKFARDKKEEE